MRFAIIIFLASSVCHTSLLLCAKYEYDTSAALVVAQLLKFDIIKWNSVHDFYCF